MLTPAWMSVANWREKICSDFGLIFAKRARLAEAVFCSFRDCASNPCWRSWSLAETGSAA